LLPGSAATGPLQANHVSFRSALSSPNQSGGRGVCRHYLPRRPGAHRSAAHHRPGQYDSSGSAELRAGGCSLDLSGSGCPGQPATTRRRGRHWWKCGRRLRLFPGSHRARENQSRHARRPRGNLRARGLCTAVRRSRSGRRRPVSPTTPAMDLQASVWTAQPERRAPHTPQDQDRYRLHQHPQLRRSSQKTKSSATGKRLFWKMRSRMPELSWIAVAWAPRGVGDVAWCSRRDRPSACARDRTALHVAVAAPPLPDIHHSSRRRTTGHGATSIESDDHSSVSVRGALELLTSAYSVLRALDEARILEFNTQVRSALPGNTPAIHFDRQRNVVRINGLYRHGFFSPWRSHPRRLNAGPAQGTRTPK
jgi:hypothetical protein